MDAPVDAVDAIVAELLAREQASMLDRTKCSMTARNVYNRLTGTADRRYNDNLLAETRGVPELAAELRAAERAGEGRAYYVHFEHVTGESSHYFILLQLPGARGGVLLLQSAVFEFSIRDWLDPGALEAAARAAYAAAAAALPRDERDAARREALRAGHVRNRDFDLETAANVRACRFAERRAVPSVAELEAAFLAPLASLCGPWAAGDDTARRCRAYRALFGCRLDERAMSRAVALGCPAAAVRFVSGALAAGTCGAPPPQVPAASARAEAPGATSRAEAPGATDEAIVARYRAFARTLVDMAGAHGAPRAALAADLAGAIEGGRLDEGALCAFLPGVAPPPQVPAATTRTEIPGVALVD